jgi:hypothetical protein
MRTVLLASLLVLAAACAKKEDAPVTPRPTPPAPPPPADAAPAVEASKPEYTRVTGFATPESVLVLASEDVYLVSNINGAPTDADDNGFISRVGTDGQVATLKWIDGASDKVKLDAPKGMAVRGGKLYVADITVVRVFDLATGEQQADIAIKGASFLNDVAVAGDKLYVTDSGLDASFKPTGTDAVYEIGANDKPKSIIAAKDLGAPNGVAVLGGEVWVVNFGNKEMWHVDGGKKVDAQQLAGGSLDGIESLGDDHVVISSWETKTIYVGKLRGFWKPLVENVESPADIGVDVKRKRLLVPLFTGNEVRFYPY